MVSLRSILGPALETHPSAPLRRKIAIQRALRDSAGTRVSAANRNAVLLRTPDFSRLSAAKETRELFILGSGPSALDLTAEHFARIHAGTSIGLNSWVFHDFIPDVYAFEEMENEHYRPVATGLSTAVNRAEVVRKGPLILHLRPRLGTPPERLVTITDALQGRLRYYGRVSVETRLEKNLTGDLEALLRAKTSGHIPAHILLDSGSSVVRMVSLGIAFGYSSIILVGVDLNSTRYFFEDHPSYLRRFGLSDFNPWLSRDAQHDTEETRNRCFGASTFLSALASASAAIDGPPLFAGSHKSKLAERFHVYRW